MFMASSILGGPGKGLIQFLRCGGLRRCRPTIIGFDLVGKTGGCEFDERMRESGVRFELLRQSRRFDWGLVAQARAIVEETGADILQSHGYKPHVLCLILKRMTGRPWVAFVHGWTAEDWRVKCYNCLEKAIVRFADVVVPVSESLARRLGMASSRKVTVIPNAIDPADYALEAGDRDFRAEYGIGADETVLGVVGRLSPEKGQAYFLEALALARTRLGKVRALLVGDGRDRAELERLVATLSLGDMVAFTGYTRDVVAVYGAIDCLVLPSLSEGMPNVALEAMLFGKPVLATRVGGTPEVVLDGETGILVPPEDAGALADGLVRLCSDRRRMKSFGREGARRVRESFSPFERVNNIVTLYNSLI
jgi:glycosyltransferase involved in cell wall biosynthesis